MITRIKNGNVLIDGVFQKVDLFLDGKTIVSIGTDMPFDRDIDADGNAKKWLAENSFGANYGFNGNIIMTDEWFCEFMFRLAVNKKYVPSDILKAYMQSEGEILPPWDPMY